jgi:hypothetical protein
MWVPAARDEGRHPPGSGELWEESWQLDFATPDGALGGSFRLGLLPAQGISRVWACVVGDGRRLVTVLEQEAPLPRAGSLDLRCDGLWTDVVCESALEHWSVGLEAFGVALDDPAEALGRVRGDRIGVGLDLGWETDGPVVGAERGGRYAVACAVHGEVLVGDEVLRVDGWGTRHHAWGVRDWWAGQEASGAGRLDDGTRWFAATDAAGGSAEGWVAPGGGPPHDTVDVAVVPDAPAGTDGLASAALVRVGGLDLRAADLRLAPVGLGLRAGRRAGLVQALCRTRGDDGRPGAAWLAWSHPLG